MVLFHLFLLSGLSGNVLASQPVLTTSVILQVPASQQLPNPQLLPCSTHATLSRAHAAFTAPLTSANAFVFRNVTAGSYIVDIHCLTHTFAPLRLDVRIPSPDEDSAAANDGLAWEAWETLRGSTWDSKGPPVPLRNGALQLRAPTVKSYYTERSTFSVLSILGSPMILLALFSLLMVIGMPYLVDNMDPEMRADWEERQKSNPMNSVMGGGGGHSASNFDMAAYLAGSSKMDSSVSDSHAVADSGREGKRKKKKR